MDGTMLERVGGTTAVVVGFYTTIEILRRTHIKAVVGAAKDINVVHACTIRLDFCFIRRLGGLPALRLAKGA